MYENSWGDCCDIETNIRPLIYPERKDEALKRMRRAGDGEAGKNGMIRFLKVSERSYRRIEVSAAGTGESTIHINQILQPHILVRAILFFSRSKYVSLLAFLFLQTSGNPSE